MKILTLYDKSGPKYHRCLLPCFLMPGVELLVNHQIEEDQVKDVDIVFINRIIPNSALQTLLDLRKKYGFKFIVDFDDHWQLDPDHYLYDMYNYYRASELMEAYIWEADGVTVTHERLADEVRRINPNVCIVPNAIPRFGQFLVKRSPSPFTRLFWAGGVTHKRDIQLLANPIKRLNKDFLMVLGGFVPDNPEYKAMATAFTNGGRLKHNLIKSLPVDSYYHAYSECDIALIPLRETRFNSFKSNLKILEAANIGANVIISNVHPYKDFPFVNYVEKQGDWCYHIANLINNPEKAKEQAEALRAYCDEHFNFDKINEKRKQFFEDVRSEQTKAREVPAEIQHAVS